MADQTTDEIYTASRDAEKESHAAALEDSVRARFAAARARMQTEGDGTQVDSAESSAQGQTPSFATPTDQLSALNDKYAAASEAAPAAGEGTPAAGEAAKQADPMEAFAVGAPGPSPDTLTNIARGIPVGFARFSDNTSNMAAEAMQYLGMIDGPPEIAPHAEANVREWLGSPTSDLGKGIEDVSGQVATSVGLSFLKVFQVLGKFGQMVAGNAVGASALPRDSKTLSTALVEARPDPLSMQNGLGKTMVDTAANNFVTRFLSSEEDDSTAEWLLKHTIEGTFIEKGLRATVGRAWTSGRKYFKDKAAREAGASEVGLPIDEELAKAADDLVNARLESTTLDAAVEQGRVLNANMPERAIQDAAGEVASAQADAASKTAARDARLQKPTLNVTPDGTAQPQNYDPLGGTITVEPGGTALLPGTPTAAPRPVPLPAADALEQAQKRLVKTEAEYKAAKKRLASASSEPARRKAQAEAEQALLNRNAARYETDLLTPKRQPEMGPQPTRDELIAERRALYDELKIASEHPDTTPVIPKRGKKVKLKPEPGERPQPTTAQEIRDRIAQIKEELKTAPKERPPAPPKAEGHVAPEVIQPTGPYPRAIPGVPEDVVAAMNRKAAVAAERVAEAEAKLLDAFRKSTGSPALLRAQAASLKESGQLSAEAAAQIDEMINKRLGEEWMRTFGENANARSNFEARIGQAEAALISKFEASTATPRSLNAQLAALKETGQISKASAERIEQIIKNKYVQAAQVPETPEAAAKATRSGNQGLDTREGQTAKTLKDRIVNALPKVVVGDHLELTVDQHKRIVEAFKSENLDEAIDALGDVFDVTNFDKIIATGDLKKTLEWLGKELGTNENTFRLQVERTIGSTFALGENLLTKTARESGQSVAQMNANLLAQFPAEDLTRTLTAYRMFELSLTKRARNIAKTIAAKDAVGDSDIELETELFGLAKMVALVNDRRAGLVSDIGRALNSLRHPVTPAVDIFRAEGRKIRGAILEDYLSQGGGRKSIRRMAAVMATEGIDIDGQVKLVGQMARQMSPTFGDALHSFWVANLLSGPTTHLKNITSSQFYMMIHDTGSELFDAAARDARAKLVGADPVAAQNLRKWAVANQAKWAAWWKVMKLDRDTWARAGRAWRLGRRITANAEGTSGIYSELGEGNYARASGLAQILRGDSHFKGVRNFKGIRILPRQFSNELADALDASASTPRVRDLWSPDRPNAEALRAQRYGTAATLIDLVGRLNSWPLHALASADELNAGIARASALHGEAFGLAMEKGLKGADAELFMEDIVKNVHTLEDLAQRAKDGLLDEAGFERLVNMKKVSDAADDYVRKMTFTAPADKIMQRIGAVREAVPGGRWTLVFLRTPGNIAKTGVTESPFWQTGKAIHHAINGEGSEAAGALGKAAWISGLAGAVLQLRQMGMVTGSGPLSYEANEMWKNEGNSPFTISVPNPFGDEPFKFNYGSYVDPVALPIQVLVESIEAFKYMDEGQQEGFAKEWTTRMARLLASKSYLNSVSDWINSLMDPMGQGQKTLVRVTANFVPQSRLMAQLRAPQIDKGLADAFFDSTPSGEGEVMTLYEYLTKTKKTRIDTGEGFTTDEAGNAVPRHNAVQKPMAFLISTAAEPLPDDIRDWMIEASNTFLKLKLEKGRFENRDLFYRPRLDAPGMDIEHMSSVYNPAHPEDKVSAELRRVGLDYSTKTLFGSINGVPLSPQQADDYHKLYSQPTRDWKPIYDAYKDKIEAEGYTSLGDTIVGVGKGEKYKQLFKLHGNYLDAAQKQLLRKYPELKQVLDQMADARDKLKTKRGSDEVAREVEARRSVGVRRFMEALDIGSN